MPTLEAQFVRKVLDALRKQVPVRNFAGVRIEPVRQEPERPFDVSFELISGTNRIRVFGEIKQAPSPKMLAEIGPWKRRMKSLKEDAFFAVVAPALSPLAQADCVADEVDFLDLRETSPSRCPAVYVAAPGAAKCGTVPTG
jgi:hypothetical protein